MRSKNVLEMRIKCVGDEMLQTHNEKEMRIKCEKNANNMLTDVRVQPESHFPCICNTVLCRSPI